MGDPSLAEASEEDIEAALIRGMSLGERIALSQMLARESMEQYVDYISFPIPTKPAAHHKALIAALEAVENGKNDRLMVLMPPGSAKSSYGSMIFPAWYLGRNPERSIIAVSHTQDLVERFGRRVRNIYGSRLHRSVFGVGVASDRSAAAQWDTEKGGEYFGVGVGGSVTGRRADLGVIDDPVKSREDADSDRSRERVWDWYTNDFKTRLKPGAAQIVIMCMAGDTPVLMSDGTEKLLRAVRPGDTVASYENGRISAAKVLNWRSQGTDRTYEIRMISGITVRANERHPFLVETGGELRWVRLRNLMAGDVIIRVARRKEPGRELHAERLVARGQPDAKASACRTTTNGGGLRDAGRHPSTLYPGEMLVSSIDTASTPANISAYSMPKGDCARFAENRRQLTNSLIGAESSASITATRQERYEPSFATIATLLSGKERPSECSSGPLSTFEITHDEIVSIEPHGTEEVFDIQVDRTENFIANGLVSHNTRWHEDDLGGRILQMEGDRWRILKLPMIAGIDDPIGRKPGERLWPEWFTPEMVEDARKDVRVWNALYQQEPTGEDGDYFKRDWFREAQERPQNLAIYGASDYAVTEGGGDFTEHGLFGVDAWSNIYILDWWRGQAAPDEWIESQLDLIQKYKPLCWFGESGTIRRSIEPFLMRRMEERRTFCRLEWLPSQADKAARCRPFQALAASGKVFVPPVANWKADVLGQLLRFPAGLHDDVVDACSLIGRGLEHVAAPEAAADVRLQTRAVVGHASAKRRR